eukprot:gene19739-26432_t
MPSQNKFVQNPKCKFDMLFVPELTQIPLVLLGSALDAPLYLVTRPAPSVTNASTSPMAPARTVAAHVPAHGRTSHRRELSSVRGPSRGGNASNAVTGVVAVACFEKPMDVVLHEVLCSRILVWCKDMAAQRGEEVAL